jgi:hypothetical protein
MATTLSYKVVDLSSDHHGWITQVEEALHQHAQDGWELVTALQREHEALQVGSTIQTMPGLVSMVLIFKRSASLRSSQRRSALCGCLGWRFTRQGEPSVGSSGKALYRRGHGLLWAGRAGAGGAVVERLGPGGCRPAADRRAWSVPPGGSARAAARLTGGTSIHHLCARTRAAVSAGPDGSVATLLNSIAIPRPGGTSWRLRSGVTLHCSIARGIRSTTMPWR